MKDHRFHVIDAPSTLRLLGVTLFLLTFAWGFGSAAAIVWMLPRIAIKAEVQTRENKAQLAILEAQAVSLQEELQGMGERYQDAIKRCAKQQPQIGIGGN